MPPWLAAGYTLDMLAPDVLILRREYGSMVGAFSADVPTKEAINRAAEEDRKAQAPSIRPTVLPVSREGEPGKGAERPRAEQSSSFD